ncbi:hypothetical protein C8R44DRAFT_878163 [Mycena epipterygia]|nr:hypothetical protein C8R44DRAFT_878163 [Mycena epipterygia]
MPRLWSSFPITLADGPSRPIFDIGINEVLTTLWRVSSLFDWGFSTVIYQSVLDAVLKCRTSSVTVSVIFMIKAKILDSLVYSFVTQISFETQFALLQHQLLPAQTAIVVPHNLVSPETDAGMDVHDVHADTILHKLAAGVTEAKVALLAEFVAEFNSDMLPYKVTETVHKISSAAPTAKIHESHQIRFANGMHRVAGQDEPHGTVLLDALVFSKVSSYTLDCRILVVPVSRLRDMPGSTIQLLGIKSEILWRRTQKSNCCSGNLRRSWRA